MRAYAASKPPARVELVVVLLPEIGSQEEGTVIGLSGISDFEERPGKKIADVTASIISTHRNKGYYIEALTLSIEFAFNQAGCNAVATILHEDKTDRMELLKEAFGWKRGVITGEGKYRRYDADKLRWAETKEFIAKKERSQSEGFLKNFSRKMGRVMGGTN